MEINKVSTRSTSLKKIFFKYVTILGISFCILALAEMVVFNLIIKNNIINPSNTSEKLLINSKKNIENAKKITKDIIPEGCKYAVFSKNFNVIDTDLEEEDLKNAILYSKGIIDNGDNGKKYYFVERKDGGCVIEYYLKPTYSLEWMNKYLPNPDIIFIGNFIILCLISTIVITIMFGKKLKIALNPLMEATYSIKNQNLDFKVEDSKVKEFNEVLNSIIDMKDELKISLKKQWKIEERKKEQISALAHDIKTPLTIIQGNAELLKESITNTEYIEYIQYIEHNSIKIEKYIQALIEMSKGKIEFLGKVKEIDTKRLIDDIYNQLIAISIPKKLRINFQQQNIPEKIVVNREEIYRVIMNVLSNAVEYSKENGRIYFEAEGKNKYFEICIIDNGKGFSNEGLKCAKNQFYMGDLSRSLGKHYGMGLYIASSIIQKHKGILVIENSIEIGGGKVTIKIPIK